VGSFGVAKQQEGKGVEEVVARNRVRVRVNKAKDNQEAL
jgi:hypothetical protein